jgi:predicted PhzF superfamily epimerase YddE/YHI9
MPVIEVSVLRVFTDADGEHGNPLGVVFDAATGVAGERQAIAAELGYSETVFIEADRRVQIFTPQVQLPFAGHPLVGAAFLLGDGVIVTPAGPVSCHVDGSWSAIEAQAEWAPDFAREELASPAAVDALQAPASGSLQAWAWQDQARGRIRARVFAPELGIAEDPATGSAAIALCAALRRPLRIEQGPGCELRVRPCADGLIELRGRVVEDERRIL